MLRRPGICLGRLSGAPTTITVNIIYQGESACKEVALACILLDILSFILYCHTCGHHTPTSIIDRHMPTATYRFLKDLKNQRSLNQPSFPYLSSGEEVDGTSPLTAFRLASLLALTLDVSFLLNAALKEKGDIVLC